MPRVPLEAGDEMLDEKTLLAIEIGSIDAPVCAHLEANPASPTDTLCKTINVQSSPANLQAGDGPCGQVCFDSGLPSPTKVQSDALAIADSSTSPKPSPRLTLPYLPGEIRNQIYSHLIASHQDHCYDYGCPSRGHAWLTPILLANRQISSELKSQFRQQHVWIYTDELCFKHMHGPTSHWALHMQYGRIAEQTEQMAESKHARHVALVHEFSLPAEPAHIHFCHKMASLAGFANLTSLEVDYWHLHRLFFDPGHCVHMRGQADKALQTVLSLSTFAQLRVRHDLLTTGRHRDPVSGVRVRMRVIWAHQFNLEFGREGERVREFYFALLRSMGFQTCAPEKERGLFVDTPRWRTKTFNFSWDGGCLRNGAKRDNICWDRGLHHEWRSIELDGAHKGDSIRFTQWAEDKRKAVLYSSPEFGEWLESSDLLRLFSNP